MSPVAARNVILVVIAIVIVAGFFVHPRGPISPWSLIQGSIWLSDTYVQQPSGLYRQDVVRLPYRWVLTVAVLAIVGVLVLRRSNSK